PWGGHLRELRGEGVEAPHGEAEPWRDGVAAREGADRGAIVEHEALVGEPGERAEAGLDPLRVAGDADEGAHALGARGGRGDEARARRDRRERPHEAGRADPQHASPARIFTSRGITTSP